MKPSLFENFKNENLTPTMIVFKRIGQVSFSILVVSILISQFNQGRVGGTTFLDVVGWAGAVGFLLGIICFAIVALFSLGKTKNNTTAQAMGKSFLKVALWIYLPAIIITAILVFTVVLPRYQ